MIITDEIKDFFGQLGPLFYILEDYRNSPEMMEKKRKEITAIIGDFGHECVFQRASVRRDSYGRWFADSEKVWRCKKGELTETTLPERPYDFAASYPGPIWSSDAKFASGLLVWIISEKLTSSTVGEEREFVLLSDGKLGVSEYTHFRLEGVHDLSGAEIYNPYEKLNVISRGFSDICKPLEKWTFRCIHETFPGYENRGVRFWEPLELIKGTPEVEIGKDGILLTHALPSGRRLIEKVREIVWGTLSKTIFVQQFCEKLVQITAPISLDEEKKLRRMVFHGSVIGLSLDYDSKVSSFSVQAGELKIGVNISAEFVLSGYDYEKNVISGLLSAEGLGLAKEVVGDFSEFGKSDNYFLRKCSFCDHMAIGSWSAQMIYKCGCHDDWEGHFHWEDGFNSIAEKVFCNKHETEALSAIKDKPITSKEIGMEGRVSEPERSELIHKAGFFLPRHRIRRS